MSSPRNAIIGHYVAAAVAFFWLAVLDLINEPSAIEVGFTWERWLAIACPWRSRGASCDCYAQHTRPRAPPR